MQARSIVDDTLRDHDVQSFRILCVGKSGVGKSALINRVLRLENSPNAAHVEQWRPGRAEIDKEFTSPENNDFVLHDSNGFVPGDTKTFNDVDRFIRQRCDSNLPLKDQLHAIWLCTETPRVGGHILERPDENLLRLAHETGTPVVIVLTMYDLLVRTKEAELQEDNDSLSGDALRDRGKEEARKAFDECIRSLERTLRNTNTPMPPHVNVSVRRGYEVGISSLVQVTRDVVRDKLKSLWATARPETRSRQFKMNASIDIAMTTMGLCRASSVRPTRMLLRDCLGRIHRDIVTCWDIRDDEKTLSSDGFKQLMLYLVQDVQESRNQHGPYITPLQSPPLEIHKISTFISLITAPEAPFPPATTFIGLTSPFADWLWSAVLDNGPSVQRLLMAYTANLITVLKSLFDIVESSPSEGTTWLKLYRVFRAYQRLDSREQIYRHIYANIQHDGQIRDSLSFHRELCELLEHELPHSGSERVGQNTQDTGASPTSSPSTEEPQSSRGQSTSPGVHAPSPGAPAPSTGGREDFDIYCEDLERKYRKQSNYRRTHPGKSSVPRPDRDLQDTDSDSTVENDDGPDNHEERFFDVDGESYNPSRSVKTASKASLSVIGGYPQRSSD